MSRNLIYLGEIEEEEVKMNSEEGIKVHGRHEYKNGGVYEGEWINNRRDGLGKFKWSDGTQYIGLWK